MKNDLEFKSLLEVKSVDDQSGQFTGYLAVFGNVDDDGDLIVKGAFKVSLASKRLIPILWQHTITEPIGIWTDLKEDDHGLLATGQLDIDSDLGKRAYSLLKMLMKAKETFDASGVFALSIGYKALQKNIQKGVRHLLEIKLFEGSFVTFSANTEANVTDVKEQKSVTTKKVDGVDLPSSAFAYVGDPEKTDTWKLPIHFPTPEQSAAHIRDALSRFSQTEGIPDGEKPKVLARIHAAADSHGIDKNKAGYPGAETKMKTFKDTLAAHELRKDLTNRRWMIEDAKNDSMDSIMSDPAMSKEDKKKAARKVLHDAADAHGDVVDDAIDALPDADEVDGGKGAGGALETKAAKKAVETAIAAHVEAERKCAKAMDLLHQASQLHTKGINLARQLSYAGAVANDDKTPPEPAGSKAAADEREMSDLMASLQATRSKISK